MDDSKFLHISFQLADECERSPIAVQKSAPDFGEDRVYDEEADEVDEEDDFVIVDF